jgi:hypothetical protein
MTERLCRNPRCGKVRERRASGRIEGSKGFCEACYCRARRAGFPDVVPDAVSHAEQIARANMVRLGVLPPRDLPPDDYDLQWLAGEPERRARRAKRIAADLVRCVAADDAEGVRLLLHRVDDWAALAVVLAECAEPHRTAVVCGSRSVTLAAPAIRPRPADDDTPEGSEAATGPQKGDEVAA